jgi:hypothetical protein
VGCAAYVKSWDFAIGGSVQVVWNEAATCPLAGGLPRLLVDDGAVTVKVISASPAAIVIERDGWRVRLPPTAFGSSDRATPYSGLERIITSGSERAPRVPP